MVKVCLLLTLIGILYSIPNSAKALVIWGSEEIIEKVEDLPDTFAFKVNDDFIDIGLKYSEFSVFFIPLFQDRIAFVGSVPWSDSVYYDLTDAEITNYTRLADITLKNKRDYDLGFFKEWGGKLIALAVLILGLLIMTGRLFGSKEDEA